MDQAVPSRLELLEVGARKSEQDLARQRQLIEDLCFDGHRTTEAEAVLQRFEATHQGLLAKLEALRGEQAAATDNSPAIPPNVCSASPKMSHETGHFPEPL